MCPSTFPHLALPLSGSRNSLMRHTPLTFTGLLSFWRGHCYGPFDLLCTACPLFPARQHVRLWEHFDFNRGRSSAQRDVKTATPNLEPRAPRGAGRTGTALDPPRAKKSPVQHPFPVPTASGQSSVTPSRAQVSTLYTGSRNVAQRPSQARDQSEDLVKPKRNLPSVKCICEDGLRGK